MGCGASSTKYADTSQDGSSESSKKKKKTSLKKAELKGSSSSLPDEEEIKVSKTASVAPVARKNMRLADLYRVENPGLAFASSQLASREPRGISRIYSKRGGELRACRTIRKRRIDGHSATQEIELLARMDHPNIVKLHEVFEDEVNTYTVFQWCEGGKLIDRISDEGNLSECEAALMMQQLLKAVNHMHTMMACHRNLDLNHMYLFEKAPLDKSLLKICDLELACTFHEGQSMVEEIAEWGSFHYMAPEVLVHPPTYFSNIDSWACGVCAYVLVCGKLPFEGDDRDAVAKSIAHAEESRHHIAGSTDAACTGTLNLEFGDISENARTFVSELLDIDTKSRCSVANALNLTWMKDPAKESKKQLSKSVMQGMKHYGQKSLLQKKIMQVVASNLNEDEIKELSQMFASLDSNGDGVVTLRELKEGLKKKSGKGKKSPSVTKDELKMIMEDMDSDGNKSISYTEFLAACLQEKHYEQEAVCWNAFKYFDRDNSGSITRQELLEALKDEKFGDWLPVEAVALMLRGGDADGNQTIEFHEFMALVNPKKDWSHLAKAGKTPVNFKKQNVGTCPDCQQQRKLQDRNGDGRAICAACWMNNYA